MTEILRVLRLTKIFKLHLLGGKEVVGCKDISFNLGTGEVLGIQGPSGAGKSTVLKCIYRSYVASTGQVFYRSINGVIDLLQAQERDILELRRQEIGYVSQFLRVVPRVSALQVVAEGLLLQGREESSALRDAGRLLTYLGIPRELWDASPATYSGGQQQRVNVARAVVTRPRLLLLDEPTASLDEQTKRRVNDLILDLKRSGTAILMVSHDRESLEQVADRMLFLDNVSENQSGEGNRLAFKVAHH
ncbi:ATP-binding cassette domain-containing protein [Desulfofundulus sp. TPOSR]|uniref:phosphonate C-P lyase system protein PhnL n=1 Tax=Desulfofundulus sp. TPOSR TaxID=2714340 RepID=UPI00140E3B5A|nr:ATP-binding cassette domain-containing protein [Desulfofundulus sp. TPOSR]NHM27587.1 ATP-binding cassette domain-containing protein [Desulfofundulus sp. TPOSR]